MVANGRSTITPLHAVLDDGRSVTLKGVLTKPKGNGTFPIVLILPGGGGLVTPYCYQALIEPFADWGIATLVIASTTAQEIDGKELFQYSFVDQADHALGALRTLDTLSGIDPNRVAIWGFSFGGLTALEMSTNPKYNSDRLKAIIAAAPICPAKATPPHTPLFVQIGSQDTQVSVSACTDLAAKWSGANDFEFQLLADAPHVFWRHSTEGPKAMRRTKEFLADRLARTD